eukprot:gene199-biopygen175
MLLKLRFSRKCPKAFLISGSLTYIPQNNNRSMPAPWQRSVRASVAKTGARRRVHARSPTVHFNIDSLSNATSIKREQRRSEWPSLPEAMSWHRVNSPFHDCTSECRILIECNIHCAAIVERGPFRSSYSTEKRPIQRCDAEQTTTTALISCCMLTRIQRTCTTFNVSFKTQRTHNSSSNHGRMRHPLRSNRETQPILEGILYRTTGNWEKLRSAEQIATSAVTSRLPKTFTCDSRRNVRPSAAEQMARRRACTPSNDCAFQHGEAYCIVVKALEYRFRARSNRLNAADFQTFCRYRRRNEWPSFTEAMARRRTNSPSHNQNRIIDPLSNATSIAQQFWRLAIDHSTMQKTHSCYACFAVPQSSLAIAEQTVSQSMQIETKQFWNLRRVQCNPTRIKRTARSASGFASVEPCVLPTTHGISASASNAARTIGRPRRGKIVLLKFRKIDAPPVMKNMEISEMHLPTRLQETCAPEATMIQRTTAIIRKQCVGRAVEMEIWRTGTAQYYQLGRTFKKF